MKLVESIRQIAGTLMTECLACLLLIKDRRVRWYAKLVVLVPLGYIISPIDLFPDAIPFLGQADDLVVVRISYALLKHLIDPAVFDECRARAQDIVSRSGRGRLRVAMVLSAVWIFLLTFLTMYLLKKMHRRSPP